MKRPALLPAFSKEEFIRAHVLLASRVATMMGRKFEEGDWSYVYCTAKNIPCRGWSNLNIDVVHNGLGVEHKILCVESNKSIKEFCGTSRMHPAATRSIRILSEAEPTEVARDVLRQYADLIRQRRQKVSESAPDSVPDMRVGWLLWQEKLQEFMYFEEEMLEPNPGDYWAEWKDSGGGARKASKNLWVYEIQTGKKRYSITTSAGAKIQPYFDVPAPNNPDLYYFRVQGEKLEEGLVRIWVTSTTALLLKRVLGNMDRDTVSAAIINFVEKVAKIEGEGTGTQLPVPDMAEPLYLTIDAYVALTETFAGVSDEHRIQLFVRHFSL